jgi:hypothetical protein
MAPRWTRPAALVAAFALGAAFALAASAPPSAATSRPALVGPALGSGFHPYSVSAGLLALCPLRLLDASARELRGAWRQSPGDAIVAEGVTLAASSAAAAALARADARVVSRCPTAAPVDGLPATQRLRVARRTAASTTWSDRVTTVAGGYRGFVAVGRAGRAVVVLGWGQSAPVSATRFAALVRAALARA